MGFNTYIYLVAVTLILGALMPQQGPKRKYYIILMAVLHAFICGFRYNHLTGDLMKYHHNFNQTVLYGWFSPQIINGGRNTGFSLFLKLVNHLTGGNYQMVLVIVAAVSAYAMAVLVYRYSPRPWLSYLVWNCLGFYIFGFSALKQIFAMAFLMLSVIGILEKRLNFYLVMMLLAVSIHVPSIVFLPAYWLAHQKISLKLLAGYLVLGAVVFLLKNQIVAVASSFYYEEETFTYSGRLGNRFIMIVLVAMCGILLKGFRERNFEGLFHLMIVSAIMQMFSGFDNIFTRMTDYYFQLSVIYIPMLFFHTPGKLKMDRPSAMFQFNQPSLRVFCTCVCVVLLYFYWTYVLNSGVQFLYDNYLNFRFMWEVN